jgi:gliding-associated putative ABC transporter substrate-binding component GldG
MEEKKLRMMMGTDNRNIKIRSWLQFLLTVAAMIIIALAASQISLRLDLTEDKRFTLSEPTLEVLDKIRNDIYIQVYLDGEMPIPMKKLRRSVQEMLDEFRLASGRKIDYEFINPADTKDARQRESQFQDLYNKGLYPVNIQDSDEEGGKSQKMIFPGMIINYNGIEVPVNFLKNNRSLSPEQNILNSIEGLEYEMIQTISTVAADTIYRIAFIEGQGELPEIEVADITMSLAKYFTIDRGAIGGKPGILNKYAAVIIAKPTLGFTEADKLVLDQYIMKGGRVLWLVEEVSINTDSLVYGETVGLYKPLNLEDMLFRYGARINPELIQDMDCIFRNFALTTGAEQRQIIQAPWVYWPKLDPSAGHPITKNLNKIKGEYSNTIDTVGLNPAIHKTILLSTSANARTLSPPFLIRLREAEILPDVNVFNKSKLPVAILLEGVFPSAFKNRMVESITGDRNFRLITESVKTKMIVIADGDVIRNDVQRLGTSENPLTLGMDRLTGQMYGNRDFLINCMNYLVDDYGLMDLRSREMKLRLLDKQRVKAEKTKWQIINIAGPVAIVLLAGVVYGFFRKRRYTKY